MANVVGKKAVTTSRKHNIDRKEITTKDVFVNRTCLSVLKLCVFYNLRRQDRKGGKHERHGLGPYIIPGLTKSGTYLLSTMDDGLALKSGINGVNLKEWQEASPAKMVKFTE
ncbi:uncharacterized protein LOC121383105 [Gigantopelta aegis]|uniref:uncharacterized protein LOC121383105 n=1 Tax=Gigantopelta aegis TaxID=1735272 RepID=UPI001B888F5D|nr:uncharacterized protein LOC121383105 [Gigantopelta aegis]